MIKKRQVYDPEFKREAVRLAQQRGVPAIAADLGLRANTLYRWKQEFQQDGVEAFVGCGHLKAEEEELRQLRRELELVKQEREILKKALVIFSQVQP
jgi:transposase